MLSQKLIYLRSCPFPFRQNAPLKSLWEDRRKDWDVISPRKSLFGSRVQLGKDVQVVAPSPCWGEAEAKGRPRGWGGGDQFQNSNSISKRYHFRLLAWNSFFVFLLLRYIWCLLSHLKVALIERLPTSVTRLGDFLQFVQLVKAFGNN